MDKARYLSVVGAVGAVLAGWLGGWDAGIATLMCFMAADYVTGMMVALVFHNSPKTQTGTANSAIGLKGLFKKGGMLILVLVAVRLDRSLGMTYIRDAVVIALSANELISLTENVGLMGVPIPEILAKGIDLLKKKEEQIHEGLD